MRLELKWAFLFFAMMLLWMVGEKLSGLHDVHLDQHPIFTNFVAIPAIIIYVLALLEKRKKNGGTLSYKEAFISGAILTAMVTLLTPLTQYLTSTFITPDYFKNVIAHTVEKELMSQEAAEAYFNLKSYIIQSTIGALLMGLFTTAIVAIFVRKN